MSVSVFYRIRHFCDQLRAAVWTFWMAGQEHLMGNSDPDFDAFYAGQLADNDETVALVDIDESLRLAVIKRERDGLFKVQLQKQLAFALEEMPVWFADDVEGLNHIDTLERALAEAEAVRADYLRPKVETVKVAAISATRRVVILHNREAEEYRVQLESPIEGDSADAAWQVVDLVATTTDLEDALAWAEVTREKHQPGDL